jgi:hypothetical protein
VPAAVNETVGSSTWALGENVTGPGPEATLQVVVTAAGGSGRPSSVTVAAIVRELGRITVRSVPAETTGAWFNGPPPPPEGRGLRIS